MSETVLTFFAGAVAGGLAAAWLVIWYMRAGRE